MVIEVAQLTSTLQQMSCGSDVSPKKKVAICLTLYNFPMHMYDFVLTPSCHYVVTQMAYITIGSTICCLGDNIRFQSCCYFMYGCLLPLSNQLYHCVSVFILNTAQKETTPLKGDHVTFKWYIIQ